MLFNSYSFLCFFPIVTLIYFVIPKKMRYIWLLIASYYFYMSWSPKYVLLLMASTIVTYFGGLVLGTDSIKTMGKHIKRLVFILCVVLNLSILLFFKYANFAIETVDRLLSFVGADSGNVHLDILLPVGISFYTFQALGYLIDVARGETQAEKSIVRYALFVSFFPQLIAGPIQRANSLLSQINTCSETKLWSLDRVCRGAIIMLWGYFQKLVIADRAGLFVDTVFASFHLYGSVELALAAILFTIQIYCDFSGYSYIAIGAAKVLGFELAENFKAPYFAASLKEFWRRWHISLSSWFKDYLYIPLGGSRCGKLKKYKNVMVTFLVSGLWHGASWSFVMWGAIHGVYQVIEDAVRPIREKTEKHFSIKKDCFSYKLGHIIITDILVGIAWIFFKMDSFMDALRYIFRMLTRPDFWVLHDGSIFLHGLNQAQMLVLVSAVLILLAFDAVNYSKDQQIDEFLFGQNTWFRWLIIYILLFMVLAYGVYGPTYNAASFIYFQF